MTDDSKGDPIGSELIRDDASFADLVTDFVKGLDRRVAAMELAIQSADFDALRVAAHQLKGSGGGYGYPMLTEKALELEKTATAHEIGDCEQVFAELKRICVRVVPDAAP